MEGTVPRHQTHRTPDVSSQKTLEIKESSSRSVCEEAEPLGTSTGNAGNLRRGNSCRL